MSQTDLENRMKALERRITLLERANRNLVKLAELQYRDISKCRLVLEGHQQSLEALSISGCEPGENLLN